MLNSSLEGFATPIFSFLTHCLESAEMEVLKCCANFMASAVLQGYRHGNNNDSIFMHAHRIHRIVVKAIFEFCAQFLPERFFCTRMFHLTNWLAHKLPNPEVSDTTDAAIKINSRQQNSLLMCSTIVCLIF